jgi:hypothetical protein
MDKEARNITELNKRQEHNLQEHSSRWWEGDFGNLRYE